MSKPGRSRKYKYSFVYTMCRDHLTPAYSNINCPKVRSCAESFATLTVNCDIICPQIKPSFCPRW